jgi:hypothetical protein
MESLIRHRTSALEGGSDSGFSAAPVRRDQETDMRDSLNTRIFKTFVFEQLIPPRGAVPMSRRHHARSLQAAPCRRVIQPLT